VSRIERRHRIARVLGSRFMLVATTLLTLGLLAGVAQAAGGGGKTDEELIKEAIFQGINLLIILGLIAYFARKPITEFFAERRQGIQSELTEAASLLEQAEKRNSELQRRLVDLSSEIEEIKDAAGRRAEEEAERIIADARATAERIRRDASAAVDQELRRAKAELREEAADLALEIASRKLSDNVTDTDRDRLIDEFITRVEPAAGAGEGASR
jgi:F-type H+-transporting ATPase subunit b